MKSPYCATLLALACIAGFTAAAAADAPGKAGEVNACSLLTDKEVGAAIGMAVEPGLRRDSGQTKNNTYSSTCLWRVAADHEASNPDLPLGGARFAILNVQAWQPGSGEARKFLQDFRDAAENHTIARKPVELSIADEAIWWGDGVAVRKGDLSFGISVHLPDGRPKERGIEETLAKQIAGRL